MKYSIFEQNITISSILAPKGAGIMDLLGRIRNLVEDSDVTQKKLAQQFGITESTMSGYMTGKVRLPAWIVLAFAEYFKVSSDFLYGLTDDPQSPLHLSQGERALVAGYRTLSREQRELVSQTIRLMQEQNRR